MQAFSGHIHAKLDAKGRAYVPVSFRQILQSSGEARFKIRKDIYKDCLILCSESTWYKKLADTRLRLNEWDEEAQELFRTFSSKVDDVELDSSGRLLIPKKYLLETKISNSVCFVGVYDSIEIWGSDQLNKVLLNSDDLKSHVRKFLSNSRRTNENQDSNK
jgi:MraZ protein